jgi:acyl-CoA synthetase (AMP-forming)/AMP-acid ligase II
MLSLQTRLNYRTLLNAETLYDPSPEKVALVFISTQHEPIVITRQQFSDKIRMYAAALQGNDILPRNLVIIAQPQNLEGIYAFWGALLAGAIPAFLPPLTEKLDPAIYMRNMADLTRISGAKAILTTEEFAPALAQQVACKVFSNTSLFAALDMAKITFFPYPPKPTETAFLQHSSGTTGLQKGVALTHQAVLNQFASYADALALHAEDVIVSWLPLYHDMGLIAGFLLPLMQGIPVVLMSPFDWVQHPALLLRAVHDYGGTLCWLPNFAYNHLARRVRQRDSDGLSLSSIRAFINCSEPVRQESHQLFLERFAPNGVTPNMLSVSYAMAENVFAVTQTPPGQIVRTEVIDRAKMQSDLVAEILTPPLNPLPITQVGDLTPPRLQERGQGGEVKVERGSGGEDKNANTVIILSCGKPIEGVEVRVMDDAGQILPERHIGEIHIRSNSLLTGYYNRPELQPVLPEGWFATGDRGYMAEGDIFIIGRSKDLIINAGKNIYPQDIEAIVNTVAGIHPGRAVVFGVPDEREGTELIAVVAEVDSHTPDEHKRIHQAVRHAVVSQADVTVGYVTLVEAGWLIKTSSGKIARSQNREKWLAQQPKE